MRKPIFIILFSFTIWIYGGYAAQNKIDTTCYNQGISYYFEAQFLDAIVKLEECLTYDLSDSIRVELLKFLGASYLALKLPSRAEDKFLELIMLDPFTDLSIELFSPKVVNKFDSIKATVVKSCNLYCSTVPKGCEVIVKSLTNKKVMGKTPCFIELPYVNKNRYTIIFTKENYKPDTVVLTVETDSMRIERKLESLVPLYGFLKIYVTPVDADIIIDENIRADTDFVRLQIGEHKIVATKTGYTPQAKKLTITENETTNVFFKLQETPEYIAFRDSLEKAWVKEQLKRKRALNPWGLVYWCSILIGTQLVKGTSNDGTVLMFANFLTSFSWYKLGSTVIHLLWHLPKPPEPDYYSEYLKKFQKEEKENENKQ